MIRPIAGTALLASITLVTAAAPPARAQTAARPVTRPTRDVDVVYLLHQQGAPLRQRSRWQVAKMRQRVDLQGDNTYIIADGATQTVDMVNGANKRVVEVKTTPGPMQTGTGLTRLDQITVAGLPCTEWALPAPPGGDAPATHVCLTDDGVLLRTSTDGVEQLRALTVTYGPEDPGVFAIPPGFKVIKPSR